MCGFRTAEQSIRRRFDRLAPLADDPRQMCLHWALAAVQELEANGIYACINAGTANFAANRALEGATHYSYEWQPTTFWQAWDKYGTHSLPELHAWAAAPELGMIVDPTTQFLPELATAAGIPWDRPRPPTTLWATRRTLPEDWRYISDVTATHYVYERIRAASETR